MSGEIGGIPVVSADGFHPYVVHESLVHEHATRDFEGMDLILELLEAFPEGIEVEDGEALFAGDSELHLADLMDAMVGEEVNEALSEAVFEAVLPVMGGPELLADAMRRPDPQRRVRPRLLHRPDQRPEPRLPPVHLLHP